MSTLAIVLIIIAAVLVFGLLSFWLFMRYVSWRVYQGTLVRTSPEVWGRTCSEPENEEQLTMWNRGLAWAESAGVDVQAAQDGILKETDSYTDLRIENDGFVLYGQYLDFGFDRAVIIIPGRCESLLYSYYFAKPFQESGFNILVIDIRCHGLSSGTYDYVGIGEDSDMIAWAKLLKERFGNREVWLHGICMGSNTAILAAVNTNAKEEDGSPLFTGLVLEGPYVSFRENFKEHLVVGKHPVWPILGMVMNLIKKHTGVDVDAAAPILFIDQLQQPVLFLAGEHDLYSVPEKTKILYEKCASLQKEIVWFNDGSHSHLRIANEQAYDEAIKNWFRKQAKETANGEEL